MKLASPLIALLLALVLITLIGGCASTAEEGTKVVYRTKEVKVPVEVPCKVRTPAEPSSWAMDEVSEKDTIFTKAAAALAEIEQRIGFEKELKAALKACQ
jgi:hypothetical protein